MHTRSSVSMEKIAAKKTADRAVGERGIGRRPRDGSNAGVRHLARYRCLNASSTQNSEATICSTRSKLADPGEARELRRRLTPAPHK
jgi:hypothetical protein